MDVLHHGRTCPPFPILVRRVRVQVIGVLRYTWATRPEAAFQPPHLPPQLAEVWVRARGVTKELPTANELTVV